jgi:hypothetical protein
MYNFDITSISYEDDIQYRDTICKLFGISAQRFLAEEDVDAQIEKVIESVYYETIDNPLFKTIYVQAASFMISENPETGLVVLFAYDYLPLFHQMLCAYHLLGDKFDDTHPSYVNLYKKLFS